MKYYTDFIFLTGYEFVKLWKPEWDAKEKIVWKFIRGNRLIHIYQVYF